MYFVKGRRMKKVTIIQETPPVIKAHIVFKFDSKEYRDIFSDEEDDEDEGDGPEEIDSESCELIDYDPEEDDQPRIWTSSLAVIIPSYPTCRESVMLSKSSESERP